MRSLTLVASILSDPVLKTILMDSGRKIDLTEEKETLFITLYAKALDNRSKDPILHDRAADDLIKTINYDFTKFRNFGNTVIVIRAKQFDEWIKEFIKVNTDAVVLYLGCGLDTRITRINPPPSVSWFDVDYPEVIELRKNFIPGKNGYHMIGSSVTSPDWLREIPIDRPAIIIAEGILEYLTTDEVELLFGNLTGHFPHGQIIFDVMNSFAIKSGRERLKETTGAVHKWAVDNVIEIDRLNPKLKKIRELALFKSRYSRKLPFGFRLVFRILSIFPSFKNMMRLMWYEF